MKNFLTEKQFEQFRHIDKLLSDICNEDGNVSKEGINAYDLARTLHYKIENCLYGDGTEVFKDA